MGRSWESEESRDKVENDAPSVCVTGAGSGTRDKAGQGSRSTGGGQEAGGNQGTTKETPEKGQAGVWCPMAWYGGCYLGGKIGRSLPWNHPKLSMAGGQLCLFRDGRGRYLAAASMEIQYLRTHPDSSLRACALLDVKQRVSLATGKQSARIDWRSGHHAHHYHTTHARIGACQARTSKSKRTQERCTRSARLRSEHFAKCRACGKFVCTCIHRAVGHHHAPCRSRLHRQES